MKRLYIFIALAIAFFSAQSQTLEDILTQVAKNNKQLIAAEQQLQAQMLSNKTGLTPSDPEVSFGRMPAKNGGGKKTAWSVSQEIDFPTLYFARTKLAKLKNEQASVQFQMVRQEIMLETKTTFLQLVYLNKMQQVYQQRFSAIERLTQSLEKRLKAGDISKLEVNKARLQYIKSKNTLKQNSSQLTKTQLELTRLNGGKDIECNHLFFPEAELLQHDAIWNELQEADWLLRSSVLEEKIARKQTSVARNEYLPSITIGVESEKTPDEQFTGPRVGLRIPLWAKKNTIKAAKANERYQEAMLESYQMELKNQMEQQLNEAQSAHNAMQEYQQTLAALDNKAILDKSLQLGHINTIEYLRELEWLYSANDEAIQLELNFHIALAKLYRYKLK
ncbi:TolC family protein [Prolixibacteraceae bacterium JC049]|nr:TolC family protein [Prolixibacteraceae bacterium JC049]